MMYNRLILLVALSLALAGCADAVQQSAADPSAEPSVARSEGPDLAGTRWVSTAVTGHVLPDGAVAILDFDDTGLAAIIEPGCNQLGAEVAIEDGQLVTGDLWTTEMGCAPEAHAADEWLAELLQARPGISRDGDTLTLTSGGSTVMFAFDVGRPPDEVGPPLIGATNEPDDPVAHAALQVLADEGTMPEEANMAPVGLATTAEQQQAQWDRFRLTTASPDVDFAEQVLLFIGFGESGSCPREFEGIEVTGQTLTLVNPRDAEQVCTADFNPRTLVLAVPRDLIPDGFVTVVSSGADAVISVEPSTEPPPPVPTNMGAVTDVELILAPASAPVGSDVAVRLVNSSEGDRAGAGPYVIVERWTGHHFESTGTVNGDDGSAQVGPGETADLMTLATSDPAFTGPGWFRLTTQLSVEIDGVASGSMDVRTNLQLTDQGA